jgi:transposase
MALKDINIQISVTGLRNLIKKYKKTGSACNKKRKSHRQRLISDRGLLI